MSRWPNSLRVVLVVFAAFCSEGQAHDLITAESAERYLAQITQDQKRIASREPARPRAQASYNLAVVLDEIRELLNRDLGAHGRLQGLSTEYLVRELTARGVMLRLAPAGKRYLAPIGYYSEALQLDPKGPHAADATFAWLQGSFYDSFDSDPLQPNASDWPLLQQQIAMGERLLQIAPAHAQIEETRFILTVLYTRAARSAPSGAAEHAQRARGAIADFQARYPDSLRTAAMPMLVEALPK